MHVKNFISMGLSYTRVAAFWVIVLYQGAIWLAAVEEVLVCVKRQLFNVLIFGNNLIMIMFMFLNFEHFLLFEINTTKIFHKVWLCIFYC